MIVKKKKTGARLLTPCSLDLVFKLNFHQRLQRHVGG
jgi:hypothetical protein